MKTSPALEIAPVEALEARIAPASLTYTDVDGDTVTITSSKGTDTALMNAATVDAGQLEMLNLANLTAFAGAKLTIAVTTKATMGDGLVNVGYLNATGIDLAEVSVNGDLAKLTVGDSNFTNGSVKTVKVQSIGAYGTNTGAGDLDWTMLGGTSSFRVNGNVTEAYLHWNNPDGGKISIGTLSIGGSLRGGNAANEGWIFVESMNELGEIKTLSVGGNLDATAYDNAASVQVQGKIGKVYVGGSFQAQEGMYSATLSATQGFGDIKVVGFLGGGGAVSGTIITNSGGMGTVQVGGMLGGSEQSGSILSNLAIKSVTVTSGVFGNTGDFSGAIRSASGSIGSVWIGGNLEGGDGMGSASIFAKQKIGNVTIKGSVLGDGGANSASIYTDTSVAGTSMGNVSVGFDMYAEDGDFSASIRSGKLGAVKIGRDMVGQGGDNSGTIFAQDSIASVTIGRDIIGGAGAESGGIELTSAQSKVKSITVGGTIVGGANTLAGSIFSAGGVSVIKIGNAIYGGTQSNTGTIQISGKASSLSIGGDVIGAAGTLSAYLSGNWSTISIGGNLVGGMGNESGYVYLNAPAKAVGIGGNVQGGDGMASGYINAPFPISSLSVGVDAMGQSITRGAGAVSGTLSLGNLTKGSIAGYVSGLVAFDDAGDLTVGGLFGLGSDSGWINGDNVKGTLTINGGIIGGEDVSNAGLVTLSSANSIVVGMISGGVNGSGTTKTNSGAILVSGNLKSIVVNGDIRAGNAPEAGDTNFGAVRAGTIGTMVVGGSLFGSSTQPVIISGQGNSSTLAIGSLTVNGSADGAWILGGYNTTGTALNGNGGDGGGSARIGTVTIMDNFENSSIASGVSTGASNVWGDMTNTALSTTSTVVSNIAKIVINGLVSADDPNGIVSRSIPSLTIANNPIAVTNGGQFVSPSTDFIVRQLG